MATENENTQMKERSSSNGKIRQDSRKNDQQKNKDEKAGRPEKDALCLPRVSGQKLKREALTHGMLGRQKNIL